MGGKGVAAEDLCNLVHKTKKQKAFSLRVECAPRRCFLFLLAEASVAFAFPELGTLFGADVSIGSYLLYFCDKGPVVETQEGYGGGAEYDRAAHHHVLASLAQIS